MRLFLITKKQLYFSFTIFSLLIFSFTFYHIYATNYSSVCEDNSAFCVSSLSDFVENSSIDIQSKINNIYSSKEKIAYLTFDDGPSKIATSAILDILKNNGINATFFVIGYRVEEFPDIVKRAYEEGNFIANHTYSHKNSKIYKNKNSFINEILDTDKVISKAINVSNYHSYVFRFPNGSKGTSYASIKKNCINYLKEIKYNYVDWNALNSDSLRKYSSSELLTNLKKSCKNKDSVVILMHDTIDVSKSYLALENSIKYLINEGYSFRTFEDFFKNKDDTLK